MDSIKNRRTIKDSITLQWTPLKIEGLLRTQSPYNGFKKESNTLWMHSIQGLNQWMDFAKDSTILQWIL